VSLRQQRVTAKGSALVDWLLGGTLSQSGRELLPESSEGSNVQSLSPEEVEAVRHELGLDWSFPCATARGFPGWFRGISERLSARAVPWPKTSGRRAGVRFFSPEAPWLTLLFSSVTAYLSATERYP
jgi:hypothetical protein